MKKQPTGPGEIALIAIAVPLLGGLMGGIYSLPAIRFTKEREPWLTLLLAAGLAVTVFGIGHLLRGPLQTLFWIYLASLTLLLLARWAFGSLGHNLERFGMVHMATLMILVGTLSFLHIRSKAARQHLPASPPQAHQPSQP
jgi:hypothetical protein